MADILTDLLGGGGAEKPRSSLLDDLLAEPAAPIEEFALGASPGGRNVATDLGMKELTDPEFAKDVKRTVDRREAAEEAEFAGKPGVGLPGKAGDYARQSARLHDPSADTLGEVEQKWAANLPERAKQWVGGLMQSAGQVAAEGIGGVTGAITGNVSLGNLVTDYLSDPLNKAAAPIAEKGKSISDAARAAQQANAPDYGRLGENHPYRYLYELQNAFVDLGAAVGVGVATRSPTAGSATLGLQVFGQQFDDSTEMGRTPDEAFQDASFMAAAEMVGENVPLKIIMQPGEKFGKRALKAGAAEGIQEVVTQALQTGYDVGVLDADMTFGEAMRSLVDAGIIGFGAGAGVAAVTTPFQKKQQQEFEDLGIAPEVAADLVRVTDVPPPTGPTPEGANALSDLGIEPGLTPEDEASPIPNEVIAAGKGLLGDALTGKGVETPFDPKAALTGKQLIGYKGKTRSAESSGNDQADNPRSTAYGRYQFTDGTWTDLGFDLSKKGDPALQEQAMDKLTGQNFGALQKAGFKTTDGNLYLAHFLGAQGAIDALANPNAPVDAKVQAANPHTKGWTNGELAAWANRKMGGKPGEWTSNPNTAADRAWAEKDAAADTKELALTVEDTLAQAGVELDEADEIEDFQPGQRVAVTQNDETVPGTVEEIYGKGDGRGVRIQRDDGTTFDENLKLARQYGAKFTRPRLAVEGERIDKDWVRFNEQSGTLGIPRAEMPQVKGEHRGALVNFLQARGIDAAPAEMVPAASLKPTQAEFSPKKAASWDFGNMKLEDRSVLVSSDGHILDGHHQWVKAQERGDDINVIRLSAPIAELLPAVHEFPSSRTSEGGVASTQATEQKAENGAKELHGSSYIILETTGSQKQDGGIFKSSVSEDGFVAQRSRQVGDDTVGEYLGKDGEWHNVQSLLNLKGTNADRATFASREEADAAAREAITRIHSEVQADVEAGKKGLKGPERRAFVKERAQEIAAELAEPKPASGGPRVLVNEVGPDGQTDAERGRELTQEERDKLKADDKRDFETMDTLAVLDARAKTNGKFTKEEATAYSMGVWEKTGRRSSWRNQFDDVDLTDPKQKAAYTKGKMAAQTELKRRGIDPDSITDAKPATESTAPEHATVGATDEELSDVVQSFEEVLASQGEGDQQITHVFDPPAKSDIVRLNDKVKVYHKDHGWMTPAEARKKIDEWESHAVAQGADPQTRNANTNRIVLSLFDLSGAWSLPWEQAGYQVWRFDIQADKEMGDVNNFSADFFGDWFGDFDGLDVYAILAACPCTDFASSGAKHFAAKDKDGRTVSSVKLVQQTMATIEYFKPAVWALENPVGRIEKLGGLPPWRLSFDPNAVGETYTKKTLLWGRFNADMPIAPVEATEGSKMFKLYGGKSLATKNARSVTPEGFAYSFFMANNAIDNPVLAIAGKYDRLDRGVIENAVKAGVTEEQIDQAVMDFYYQDLDDDAANAAIAALTAEPTADQPSEAPTLEADVEALLERAAPHQEELAALGRDYPEFKNPGLKSKARIIEKVELEDYPSAAEIKDIVRAGFFVETRERATAIVARIRQTFPNVTDKGWKMVDGDYFDIKLIINWPDGTKGEVQIVPKPVWDARLAGGAKEYQAWRVAAKLGKPEAPALLAAMEARYAKAVAGTSWESLASELKSASGNAALAASSESETPSLVASPGAEPQRPADQTTAQSLPETAPVATSRSSTSKSETPSIADNVGNAPGVGNVAPPSDYGTKNRIFTKDAADAARALIRDKLRTQLNSGIDPELLMAGMQLAGYHIEAGARKFADLSRSIADDLGVELSRLKPYLRAWYNSARDALEDAGEDVADMDGPGAVRAALAMIPDEPILSTSVDDNGDNYGDTATENGAQKADRAGDARQGSVDASGAVELGSAGQGVDGAGDTGGGQLPSGPDGIDGSAGRDASGDGVERPDGAERSRPASARTSRRVRDTARGSNFRAKPGALKRDGGWLATANRNLDIIEKVQELEESGRVATPAEQELLSKYVGWGASEIRNKLFGSVDRRTMTINKPWNMSSEWAATIERAIPLIKGDELQTALQSTQYAHYTSEGVIRGMWAAMERFGFGGGRILEPGMGIGHFFTAAPDSIADHSTYTGIEFDAFTAKIAKHLLPQENVIGGDFIKQKFPDGFFDAAIGNPPFASTKVLNDPAYKKLRFSLHDYFFAKSIDKVRPGGILAFVTSRYTMDKLDAKARNYISERADFLGAVRLPEDAFRANAGTDVVTDILFFQKRAPGTDYAGQAWAASVPVSVGGQKVNINEYFKAHPEMVLGKFAVDRGMYRDNELTVKPYLTKGWTLEKSLANAVKRLPEGIYTEALKEAKEAAQAKTFERDFAPASTKEGGLYEKDGKVLVVADGSGVPVEAIHDKVKAADHAWLKGYVKLRDLLKTAQKAQLLDEADWEPKLEALRKEYRAFTKKHGRIKDFTPYDRTTTDDDGETQTITYRRYKWDRLMVDVEAPLVGSLERITDAGDIVDGPFLLGRTLNKPVRPIIETVDDALAVTLDEVGRLDLEYLGKLLGRSSEDVVAELADRIYQTPAGEWQTADEYLSGNVLDKLEEARAAAVVHPELERNVQALIEVQPAPLSYDKITVRLGMPWIKPETVSQFADEVLEFSDVKLTYEPATAHWNVEGAKNRWARSNTAEYGTPERTALELLDAVLNNRSIKITYKDSDGKTVTLPDQTAAAVEAAKKINDRFKTWLWEDSVRTAEYVDIYNRSYNNIAPRKFNGDHLTLPGLSANFRPHPHVKRAVWRIIQTGNTYLAHAVGAGKTAEQIISGMEQRRLGLIKKPMYVVPNHMLKQFSQEFLELYPAANIMVADEQAFHTGNRQRFLAQASLNDPDAIILTHSSFGKIDTSPAMRKAILDDMIGELEDALEDMKRGGTNEGPAPRHLVSKLEKQIEGLTKKFEGKTGSGKDKLLTFDEMGVDMVYIDEAHEFRKLDFATNRNAKGIDSTGSARALDLYIKSQWLEQQNPGRSIVLASGTPVTNTMAELFTVMRYMDRKTLERDNIANFDAWANMFGEVVAGYERNAAGGYEIVERFAKFVNVPELMKRVRNFMDVLLSSELGDLVKRPKINGGGPQNIIAPQSDALADYMERTLNERLRISREWKPSKEQPGNPDPVINIITDARLSAIDMRFVTAGRKPDPDTKLNQMISKIAEIHKATANVEYLDKKTGQKQPRKGAAQIVFSPVGLGEQVALNRGFNVREWIDSELIRQGVKKSEIGWMSDANTHAKKEQLQKDVRSGKVRILVGSPKNMGTGLNVQDRLIALHFLAPPWYPADVTQPHGRIERQGNLNEAVDIFWYATKGTYDSTGWGMVARKQKFIDDALSGDDAVRTLEDISEINMFEMAAALAAGDDRVIRIAALSGEVEKLTRLKGAHADTQRSLASDINWLGKSIPRQEAKLGVLRAAQTAKGTGYEPMNLTIGGTKYEKHGEAGDALKAAMVDVLNNNIAVPKTEVGRWMGKHPLFIFPVNKSASTLDLMLQVGEAEFELQVDASNPAEIENLDSVGLIRRIDTKYAGITSAIQQQAREIEEDKTKLAAAQKKYGAPFPQEQELAEAITERNLLQAEMAAETAAKNAPPAPAAPSAIMLEADRFTAGLTPEQVTQATRDLEGMMRQLLPGDTIALSVARRLFHEGEEHAGQYWPSKRLIAVALTASQGKAWVLGHESVHAMRNLGLFTAAEWRTLVEDSWTNSPKRQADIIERWGPNLTDEQRHEEAVAEAFGEYFDIFNRPEDHKSPFKSLAVRALRRILHFVSSVSRVVARLLDNNLVVTAADALAIFRRMETGAIGSRPEGFGEASDGGDVQFSAIGAVSPASPDFGGDSERRWQEAKKGIGSGPSVLEKASAWWDDLTGGFTRHWRAMPNSPRFADVSQQLRKLEAAPDAAMESSVRYLRELVGTMNAEEYDLFSRKVVLDDLSWDAGEGRDLPFGFTPTTLKAARQNVDAQVALNPKLIRAMRDRKFHNQQITDAMVRTGVLTADQVKNPAYFRHIVLDYARNEAALARSPTKVKSPYWAKRMGSTMDINANLLEAELDWLQKAKIDTVTAETLEWIKDSPLNQREQLRQRARDENKAKIDRIIANNPAARKEDAWFRSNIARGFQMVQEELEAGNITNIPPHLEAQAASIESGSRAGEPPYAFMAWVLDHNKPGAMGAGMVLKYAGLRKQWRRKTLGDSYVDPEDVKGLVSHYKPEGMAAFQPIEGRHLFTAKTISESALDMFVTKLGDTASPGLDRTELQAALGSVRNQLVVGGDRYTMVIPEELAATLEEFGDRRGEGMVAQVFGGLQAAWKRWVLINPRRFLKYNLNNQTGDLDAIVAGKPRALLRVKEAWTMLREASKGRPSQRYTEALERGVFTSGLSAQEIPDINRLSEFRHLTDKQSFRPDKLTVAAIGKVWRVLQDTTNFREALFRLAAYLEYADEIESGKPQLEIGYGASIPRIVDAVTDPHDRAALLARDLIGDYGAISVAGGWLRRYLIPFWSWTEINTKRYWRLTANAYTTSKAKGIATGGLLGAGVAVRTGVSLYARMALLYGLLYLWNNGLFPDEEDDLDEEQAAQLHMILGRDQDGKVISLRTQGALSDVLKTLGFHDAMLAWNRWRDGQGSPGSIATAAAKAPINRVATSTTPLFSMPVEQMIDKKLWPDVFEPRVIHDNWRHLFAALSVENEYDAVADRPSRGYLQSWVGSIVYKRDPGEMAYDEARGIAYDWLERTKGGSGGGGSSLRSEALRDYRMALRYGDESAARKALLRYEELGGTMKSLGQSIKRAHPLGPIAKKDRAEFLSTLTDEQVDTFAEAEVFWQDVYANAN